MQALKTSPTFSPYSIQRVFSPRKNPKVRPSNILPQSDIAELFFSVWQRQEMTEPNRQRLKIALLSYDDLNECDYQLINRLLHAVKRGWITMTEESL